RWSGTKEAPQGLGLCAVHVHGRHQLRRAVAEVVGLPVKALNSLPRASFSNVAAEACNIIEVWAHIARSTRTPFLIR
ncbi:hypothetical protein BHE74_00055318, partial [Ensete ventricosum]